MCGRVLHAAHSDVFMQIRAHACVLSDVLQWNAVWWRRVTRCVAECCTRRIATYLRNRMYTHAFYHWCSSVMQCDAMCCRSVMQCGGVCCRRRRRAPYPCNPTHVHACYWKLPCHEPPRFPLVLSIRVCLRLHVCALVYVRLCACGCVRVGLGVCVGERGEERGGSQVLAEWPY